MALVNYLVAGIADCQVQTTLHKSLPIAISVAKFHASSNYASMEPSSFPNMDCHILPNLMCSVVFSKLQAVLYTP